MIFVLLVSPLLTSSLYICPSVGMPRMEPGVHLYSRKVLIQRHAGGLLPPWLRFMKGIVDSRDIPLNIRFVSTPLLCVVVISCTYVKLF